MNVLLALGCLLAVLLGVAGILLRDAVRSRSLQRRASALGFSFEPVSDQATGPQLKTSSCLQDGCSTVAFNVLTGEAGGFRVRIFDLRDESLETPALTTVAAFRSQSALPGFELGLRGLFGRVAEVLRARPANGKEKLAKQFSIGGAADDKRVEEFLTVPRMERLRLSMNQYRITCNPEWVFVYRPGIKIKARDFSYFLEETTRIAEALLKCASNLQKTAPGGGLSISRGAGA